MDYLDLITSFHKKYGRRWYVIDNKLFFRFLLSSLFVFAFIVYYLANHSFDRYDIERMIGDRYREYIVGMYDKYDYGKHSRIELFDIDAEKERLARARARATARRQQESTEEGISRDTEGGGPATYEDLLRDREDFETLSYDVETLAPPTRFFKQNRDRSAAIEPEDELLYLDDYKIYRNASIYIDVPEYRLEKKTNYIYRDQEDILRVIYSKSGIIESCYLKAVRTDYVQPGFVKVEFKIAASGYVLPASIRILDSTIRNKVVEQCIKKNIRRWRNFEKLDNSDGIAHVVHKFVFN